MALGDGTHKLPVKADIRKGNQLPSNGPIASQYQFSGIAIVSELQCPNDLEEPPVTNDSFESARNRVNWIESDRHPSVRGMTGLPRRIGN